MFIVPSWISDKHSVDSLHEYQMRMNINQFPRQSSSGVRTESNYEMSQRRERLLLLLHRTWFQHIKGKKNVIGSIQRPWPHSWQRKGFIKSNTTSQESQFVQALFPTFSGFVEYADAIFCLEFQITPGSQLAGEKLFKLSSHCKHRKWNHTALERG